MKYEKIAICLPGLNFSYLWVSNFLELLNYLQRKFSTVETIFGFSNNIYASRNRLLDQVLEKDYDAVLWMDDDNTLSISQCEQLFNDLEKLPELDGILAWYWLQPHGYQIEPTVSCGLLDEPVTRCLPLAPQSMFEGDNIVGVHYGGFGSFLCRGEAIKKVGKNGFNPIPVPNSSMGFSGDDVAWFMVAKEKGLMFGVDKRVHLPHFKIRDVEFDLRQFVPKEIQGALAIQGWMSLSELNWLYAKAQEMDLIAEIGSWKGRSSYALGAGCKGEVWCFDTWEGSTNELENQFFAEAQEKDIHQVFKENLKSFKHVKSMKLSSEEASKVWSDKQFDMVFIDGNHSYDEATKDIRNWLPKAKKLLCGHDANFPTVRQALRDSGLDVKEGSGSIWYVEINEQTEKLVEKFANRQASEFELVTAC